MAELWVPPKVSRELRDASKQRSADLREMFWFQTSVCAEWNAELQKVDPYMRLGQAKPNASFPGVKAGFYHLIRIAPGVPALATPITGPDGGFAEPSSAMLDALRASDLQNPRVIRDRLERERQEVEAAERERIREEEARRAELDDRLRAAQETSVSMNTDAPWSQGVAGRRGARKAA